MNKIKYKKSSGLSLVEVLLSIVILSVGISALMIATNKCLVVLKRAQNRDIAYNLIRQIDTDYPIQKNELDEKIESGSFKNYDDFTWEREIFFEDFEKTPGLFLINLTVMWSEKGNVSNEKLVTISMRLKQKALYEK